MCDWKPYESSYTSTTYHSTEAEQRHLCAGSTQWEPVIGQRDGTAVASPPAGTVQNWLSPRSQTLHPLPMRGSTLKVMHLEAAPSGHNCTPGRRPCATEDGSHASMLAKHANSAVLKQQQGCVGGSDLSRESDAGGDSGLWRGSTADTTASAESCYIDLDPFPSPFQLVHYTAAAAAAGAAAVADFSLTDSETENKTEGRSKQEQKSPSGRLRNLSTPCDMVCSIRAPAAPKAEPDRMPLRAATCLSPRRAIHSLSSAQRAFVAGLPEMRSAGGGSADNAPPQSSPASLGGKSLQQAGLELAACPELGRCSAATLRRNSCGLPPRVGHGLSASADLEALLSPYCNPLVGCSRPSTQPGSPCQDPAAHDYSPLGADSATASRPGPSGSPQQRLQARPRLDPSLQVSDPGVRRASWAAPSLDTPTSRSRRHLLPPLHVRQHVLGTSAEYLSQPPATSTCASPSSPQGPVPWAMSPLGGPMEPPGRPLGTMLYPPLPGEVALEDEPAGGPSTGREDMLPGCGSPLPEAEAGGPLGYPLHGASVRRSSILRRAAFIGTPRFAAPAPHAAD